MLLPLSSIYQPSPARTHPSRGILAEWQPSWFNSLLDCRWRVMHMYRYFVLAEDKLWLWCCSMLALRKPRLCSRLSSSPCRIMHHSVSFEEHAEDDVLTLPTSARNPKGVMCLLFYRLSTDFQMWDALSCGTLTFLKDFILQELMVKLLKFQMTLFTNLKIFFFLLFNFPK